MLDIVSHGIIRHLYVMGKMKSMFFIPFAENEIIGGNQIERRAGMNNMSQQGGTPPLLLISWINTKVFKFCTAH